MSSSEWWAVVAGLIQFVPAFTLTPRLVLSLREVYARDLRGRMGSDMDTAFGLISTSSYGTAASTIIFAEGGRNAGGEQCDEIQMEERDMASACEGA